MLVKLICYVYKIAALVVVFDDKSDRFRWLQESYSANFKMKEGVCEKKVFFFVVRKICPL